LTQVRKDEGDQFALLLGFRTLEDLCGSRSHRNQAFQGRPVVTLVFLMLLNAQREFGLPALQFARLLVVFVLRNSPSRGGEPAIRRRSSAAEKHPLDAGSADHQRLIAGSAYRANSVTAPQRSSLPDPYLEAGR
jgi:hypothetical protein